MSAKKPSGVSFPEILEGFPKNLGELLNSDYAGYELKKVYFLQLKHGLMGFFPAVFTDSDRMVLSLNPEITKKVWETLSPRRSTMSHSFFLVHKDSHVGYEMRQSEHEHERSLPHLIMTDEEFAEVTKVDEPFEWYPGLMGEDMSPKEFTQTIQAAAKHLINL